MCKLIDKLDGKEAAARDKGAEWRPDSLKMACEHILRHIEACKGDQRVDALDRLVDKLVAMGSRPGVRRDKEYEAMLAVAEAGRALNTLSAPLSTTHQALQAGTKVWQFVKGYHDKVIIK